MTIQHTTEGRLATLEANYGNMKTDITELSDGVRKLNVTVANIAESLRLFKWIFSLAVAAGPGVGVLLYAILENMK
jgi:uncharacterized coiled-coil protein SlyX